MLLAIDIGNTNIVIGGIQDDQIVFEARIATERVKTSDQYGAEIKNMLALFDVKPSDIHDCIISSVVPPCSIPSIRAWSSLRESSPWWSAPASRPD